MKVLKYIIKTFLWSVSISILIRIVFGLYSVFGPIALIVPAVLGIAASVSLSTSGNAGFLAVSLFHIILTAVLYAVFDFSGIFRMLPSDSADFFAGLSGSGDPRVNILWCILFVMPVYFFCFIVSSGIISAVKSRRKDIVEEEYDKYSEYNDNYTYIRRNKR